MESDQQIPRRQEGRDEIHQEGVGRHPEEGGGDCGEKQGQNEDGDENPPEQRHKRHGLTS